ncbi:MAG: hypothetical protein J6O04_00630 [Selenomonadaceae bacterium]|nr:hypothetical protein [Selenomonadaceae bacterium]
MFLNYNDDEMTKRFYKIRRGKVLTESVIKMGSNKKGYVTLTEGTVLYNAPKTTGDTVEYNGRVYNNMIELWEDVTGETAYYCKNENCEGSGDEEDIVGGHFVFELVDELQKGDTTYILPSCKNCNHYTNRDAFVLKEDTKAVVVTWDK